MLQRPLDQIQHHVKVANRTPHLRKKNFVQTDVIDRLDNIGFGGAYHHEGPFDATLASRNRDKRYAPVDAVKTSNMEALKATPPEFVQDSLQKHVPLQGTAIIPPGEPDMFGRTLHYQEGPDIMREDDAPGGPYRRWPGVQYDPKDLKGKGEPSFTKDNDEKAQKQHRKHLSVNGGGAIYEMQPTSHHRSRSSRGKDRGVAVRQRSTSDCGPGPSGYQRVPRGESRDVDTGRTSTSGKRLSDGLKRRLGSLRDKLRDDE
ncbi:hypothetical protein SLS62_007958 [Diatrype stigma]|uniref:Uncharacterized protein n=1 Tax=Diatrype stigma TaxID=117547 RepID=A0AAN9UL79_9PEZI